jgi:mitochondrial distribution and morphology protein 31
MSRSCGTLISVAKVARFDRYALIHDFFTRPRPSSSVTRPNFTSTWSPSPPSSFRLNFHSACIPRNSPSSPHTAPRTPEPQQSPRQSTPVDRPLHHNSHLNSTSNDNNYPRFFRRLAQSLPHISRPSRDDFLNAANGFVQRMRVRVRWFFIRNFHKFNADDISAFVTWFLVGQGLWILVGTSVLSAMRFPL